MRSILAAFACILCVSTAHAEWTTETGDGAFDIRGINVAGITAGDYTLALRCRGEKTEIVYLTSEAMQADDTLKLMNTSGVKLRLRVDRGETVDLDATASETNGNLVIIANASVELFEEVRSAKTGIAASIFVIGRVFHTKRFDPRGADEAVAKIMKNCDLS